MPCRNWRHKRNQIPFWKSLPSMPCWSITEQGRHTLQSMWSWHDTIRIGQVQLLYRFSHETNKHQRREYCILAFLWAMSRWNICRSRLGMQNLPRPNHGVQALRYRIHVPVQDWVLTVRRLLHQQRWLHCTSRRHQWSSISCQPSIFQKPNIWKFCWRKKSWSFQLWNDQQVLLSISYWLLEVRRQQELSDFSKLMRLEFVRLKQRSLSILHKATG